MPYLAISLAFAALLAIGAAASQGTANAAALATPQPLTTFAMQTLTYKTVGGISIKADVYRATGNDLRPIVVWIHPGALIGGSRGMLPPDELDRLLRARFVVVAIDYRLAPETKLPQILLDIEDAHRWVREKGAALFQGDPNRVATVGASAGGYLALMAGARIQPRLKAIVSFYGYGDVAGEWYSRPDRFYLTLPRVPRDDAYRGVGRGELTEGAMRDRNAFYVYLRQNGLWPREVVGFDPETEASKYLPFSAERLVTPAYPPTLLLHGDRDVDVPFKMSERMAAALAQQGVEHRLVRMEGFNHAFDVFSTYPPQGAPTGLSRPEVAEAFDAVVSFLTEHLGQ